MRVALLLLLVGCGGPLRHIPPPSLPDAQPGQRSSPPVKALEEYAFSVLASSAGDAEAAREHITLAIRFDPNSAYLHSALGWLELQQGDLDAAQEALARAVELNPTDAVARRRLATAFELEGEPTLAVEQLEALLALTRDDRAFIELIQLHLILGDRAQAARELERWAQLPPAHPEQLQRRAAFYLTLDRPGLAWEDLARLVEGDQAGGPALDLLMDATKRSGRLGSGIALLQRVARWEPGNEDIIVRLGGLCEAAGDDAGAAAAWDELDRLRGGQDAGVKLMLAQASLEAGDAEAALSAARLAATLDPEAPGLVSTQARSLVALDRTDEAIALVEAQPGWRRELRSLRLHGELMAAAGHNDRARASLELALEQAPSSWAVAWELAGLEAEDGELERALARVQAHPDPLGSEATWQLSLAQLERRAGALDAALERLAQAEERWPREAGPPQARGSWLMEAQRDDEALAIVSAALGRLPDEPALAQLQAILLHRAGTPERARSTLEAALVHNPDDAHLLNDLAYLSVEAGVVSDEVLAMARRAVDQQPASGAFLDTLGWVLLQRGEREEALALLERAARCAPENETIAAHLDTARRERPAGGSETR